MNKMKNSLNHKINICFFGSYDKNYSRNQIILKGLADKNITISEVHLDLPKWNIDKKAHLSTILMAKRLFRKVKILPIVLKNLNTIKKADIILSAYPTHLDMPLAFLISRIFNKPLIFDPFWSFSLVLVNEFGLLPKRSLRAIILRITDKVIFSLADYILFDTKSRRNYYCKSLNIPKEKTRILHLGADDSLYQYSGINLKKKKTSVIYYGLYNPMHGVEHIIECAKLAERDKNIEFILIGNGQTYQENREKASKLKLKNITFLPNVTEKDSKKYLDKGDIFLGFLNTSISANMSVPNKVFQGLALGKAVITAESEVTKYTFKHKENIYLCKLSDPISLYNGIVELKNNSKLMEKIATNGHTLFKSTYTPNIIGVDFQKILAGIHRKKKLKNQTNPIGKPIQNELLNITSFR